MKNAVSCRYDKVDISMVSNICKLGEIHSSITFR